MIARKLAKIQQLWYPESYLNILNPQNGHLGLTWYICFYQIFRPALFKAGFLKQKMTKMNTELVIRKIGQKDIAILVDYRLNYLAEMQGTEAVKKVEETRAALLDFFSKAILQQRFFAFAAEFDGVAVSFGGMVVKEIPGDFSKPTYLEGDILNMYTVPEARRMGIAQLILKALLEEAVKLGISKVALHTSKDGEHLYRGNGFTEPAYPYLELVLKQENFTH